ncbi:nucleotidyl transferase AbiEii/AbiGii toxin family protein [Hyphomonadaceae bacterium ML37]|nr:nucleotidyl transferase AbiEii/AbiGii toxin family protein [Hyphomonadaceae bacterium ML37]
MIPRAELMAIANEKSLRPDVVEKDYALGWILAGISAHPALRDEWAFKGGTCLKKCYFETYRFSEDLDFTLRDAKHLDVTFLHTVFSEISEWVYDQAGIEMPVEQQTFEIINNPRGNPACQGKVAYKGPISPRSLPRVKLDLTADERIVMPPVRAAVYHPYSDVPPDGIDVLTYTYEEAFGEKVRALAERTRPRDLYDVINLFRNDANLPDPAVLRDVIAQKCDFKGIPFPALELIQAHRDELAGSWGAMLGHQLPTLPDLEAFLGGLPEFFSWLEGERRPEALQAYPHQAGAMLIRERTLPAAVPQRARPALEIIRFAAANRLCVDLTYRPEDGGISTRRIEPYSLRQSQAGDVLLMAVRRDNGQPRSYRTDRIINASVTNETFKPRYEIELFQHEPRSSALDHFSLPFSEQALEEPRERTVKASGPS